MESRSLAIFVPFFFLGSHPAAGLEPRAGGTATGIRDRVLFTRIPGGGMGGEVARAFGFGAPLPSGAAIAVWDPNTPEKEPQVLTSDFASAGRPCVSSDAMRILFVAKKSDSDLYGIWEMDVSGNDPRLIVEFPTDCLQAVYLSSIFTLDADRPVDQLAFVARTPESDSPSIFTARMDGTRIRRVTFAPFGASSPLLLTDGRLLFRMGLERLTDATRRNGDASRAELFTICADGTDLFPFSPPGPPEVLEATGPCEAPGDLVAYVERSGGASPSDQLVGVTRTRNLHSRRLIVDAQGGRMGTPACLPDGMLLVAWRATNARSVGLFAVHSEGKADPIVLLDDQQWDETDPVVLAPRKKPEGHSSVVNRKKKDGQIYCMDANLSDEAHLSMATRATTRRVRLLRYAGERPEGEANPPAKPVESANGQPVAAQQHDSTTGSDVLMGEYDVEGDGSFSIEVPAETPFRLETLDDSGRVLRSMRTWMWVMPGERRGCIGCHEDRELAPPNRHVLALRKPPQIVQKDTGKSENATNPQGDNEQEDP